MSTFTPNRRKLHRIHGAMLLVVDEVLLRGGQSLLNRCLVSSHQNPPCVALNTGTARLHPLSGANRKTFAHSEPYRFLSQRVIWKHSPDLPIGLGHRPRDGSVV